jgi:integration host factor subunit alpha
MSVTKKDISDDLVKKNGISHGLAKAIVNQFFDEIKNALISGEEVKISGLGNFKVLNKSARPGRNPKTGEEVTISARKVVTFKAGQKLKKIVLESP